MNKEESYSVSIEARGEGVRYCEGDQQYLFNRSHGKVLEAYSCSDGEPEFSIRELTEEEKARIIPRIVEHLEKDGHPAKVLRERPSSPLKTSEEIFLERRKSSGTED